jgi:hypothetical protein
VEPKREAKSQIFTIFAPLFLKVDKIAFIHL